MKKGKIFAIYLVLVIFIVALPIGSTKSENSQIVDINRNTDVETVQNNIFSEKFDSGFYQWDELVNTGSYTTDIFNGYLDAQSTTRGTLSLLSFEHLTDLNTLIDADLFSSSYIGNSLVSVYITFFSDTSVALGFLRYYLSDNVIWTDTTTQKNIRVADTLDSFVTLGNYILENDRNLTYCLDTYLTGITQESIAYYGVNIYSYNDGASHDTRFDNIFIYSQKQNNILLSDFSGFTQESNASYIHSSHSSETLNFTINNETIGSSENETYVLDLTSIGNCTDFYISVDIFYNFTSNSSIGSFGSLALSLYDHEGDFGVNRSIGHHSVDDYLTNSSGRYTAIGYPSGVPDYYSTDYGSAGIIGNITLAMNRTQDFLSIHMYNLSDSGNLLYWHSSSYGLDQYLGYLQLFCATTDLNSTLSVSISNFYGYFDLHLEPDIITQNDAYSGTDAGSDYLHSITIDFGTLSGALPNGDVIDFYKIYLTSYKVLTLTLSASIDTNFDLRLFDADNFFIGESIEDDSFEQITYGPTSYGYYYISIIKSSGDDSYILTTSMTDVVDFEQNDGNSGDDAGDLRSTAVSISSGTITGSLPYGDLKDYYSFNVHYGDIISIELTNDPSITLDLNLRDLNIMSLVYVGPSSTTKVLNYEVTTSYTTLYLEISKIVGDGNYSFDFEITSDNTSSGGNWVYYLIGLLSLVLLTVLIVVVRRRRRVQSPLHDESRQSSSEQSESTPITSSEGEESLEETLAELVDDLEDTSNHEKEIFDSIFQGYSFGLEKPTEITEELKDLPLGVRKESVRVIDGKAEDIVQTLVLVNNQPKWKVEIKGTKIIWYEDYRKDT